ncbi:MAG: hypothetical protein KUG65_08630 [Sphingomonadaceae bacterium]|nr:hypothetical protein [Sphingomonadaceae bacterium]
MLVEGLDHVELLLPAERITEAAKAFGDLLCIPFPAPELREEHKILCSASYEAGIVLTSPVSAESPLMAELESKGSEPGGAGPIVWRVNSIDAVREHARKLGVGIAFEAQGKDASRMLYLSPEDCCGYMPSFVERPGVPNPVQPPLGALVSGLNRIEFLTPAEVARDVAAFYEQLLQTQIPMDHMPEHNVLSGVSWEAGFEVYAPGSGESVLNQHLAQKGARGAIGPIVWNVPDIEMLKQRARELGHDFQYEFKTDNYHQVCLRPETLFGYMATFCTGHRLSD